MSPFYSTVYYLYTQVICTIYKYFTLDFDNERGK